LSLRGSGFCVFMTKQFLTGIFKETNETHGVLLMLIRG
jgi:hypothetical protein